MKILKFGGSSISSSDRIKNVIKIVKDRYLLSPHLAVVVSAFGGATDDLIHISTLAAQGDVAYLEEFSRLKNRHFEMAESLVTQQLLPEVNSQLNSHFKDLNDALHGVLLVRELSKRTL